MSIEEKSRAYGKRGLHASEAAQPFVHCLPVPLWQNQAGAERFWTSPIGLA